MSTPAGGPVAPSFEQVRAWFDTHTFRASPDDTLLAVREAREASGNTISVVLPSMDEAETIGPIVSMISEMLLGPVVDEIVVVDGGSSDATVAIAREAGATDVFFTGDIMPELPMQPGKGEAMWRSLAATTGDIVVWVDSDIRNFHTGFVAGLVAPLLADPGLLFVKGFYERPLRHGEQLMPGEGGRVTELLARPLGSALFPELGGFIQPLAGEYAGRRQALEAVPFFTGYSVEVGLLLDLIAAHGLDAMAQADLGERIHRNRPLADLGPMSAAITRALLRRAVQWQRLELPAGSELGAYVYPQSDGHLVERDLSDEERPPMQEMSGKMGAS